MTSRITIHSGPNIAGTCADKKREGVALYFWTIQTPSTVSLCIILLAPLSPAKRLAKSCEPTASRPWLVGRTFYLRTHRICACGVQGTVSVLLYFSTRVVWAQKLHSLVYLATMLPRVNASEFCVSWTWTLPLVRYQSVSSCLPLSWFLPHLATVLSVRLLWSSYALSFDGHIHSFGGLSGYALRQLRLCKGVKLRFLMFVLVLVWCDFYIPSLFSRVCSWKKYIFCQNMLKVMLQWILDMRISA